MSTHAELKELVRRKYAEIAEQQKEQNLGSCCGATGCSTEVYNLMADEYAGMEGYVADADLGLGCGLPTEYAGIREGDTVVDLGAGAGNDCFIARAACGDSGRVIGVDMTPAMIDKARANAVKMGYTNVEFRLGEIEHLPITSNAADVIVSNCVLNLVPDKKAAFAEMYRVLKPSGHFSVSDIVLAGELPDNLREAAELYAGCVSGAIQKETYLQMLTDAGFSNVHVQKEKNIHLPDDILQAYLTPEELEQFRTSGTGIYSVTVYGAKATSSCCTPGGGCC